MNQGSYSEDLQNLVDHLIAHKDRIPGPLLARLRDALGLRDPASFPGLDFDLLEEVKEQLKVIRLMRAATVDTSRGTIESVKEAKEVVSSSTSLLSLLTKLYGDIYNMSRLRAIELATVETIKEQGEEVYGSFLEKLHRHLEAV